MAISDLFSTSFLFSVAIIIILIGGIFAYVSYRMSEQDHKLTSMVNLVSILAQDLQFVKSKLASSASHNSTNTNNVQYPSDMMGGQSSSDLISVSDDGDEDVYDEEVDEEEENTTVDDSSCASDDEEDEIDDSEEKIKLLNLTLVNEDINNDSPIEDLGGDFEELETPHKKDIKTIHLETPINFEETEIPMPLESEQTDLNISGDDLLNLKNVTINDLGETEDVPKSEYKKMSLNKLREVVVSKGLVADASKLKKNDILKLLGDE